MDITARILIKACLDNHFSPIQVLHFVQAAMKDACPHKTTIYRWIKKIKSGVTDLNDRRRRGRSTILNIRKKINHFLKRNKFSSTRSIGRLCKVSRMTVYRRMKNEMLMKWRKLKKIPYTQNSNIMNRRVEISTELLNNLMMLQPIDVITCDENLFYFYYSGDSIWVKNNNEVEIVEKQRNYSKKVMISIFWNFNNLYYIKCLPVKETYDTDYVVFTLFPALAEVAERHRPKRGIKSYALHWDNATPHKSKDTTAAINELFKCCLEHPPYSPDLAPSDFFLFGHLKRLLIGKKIVDEEQLIYEIEVAFRSITKEMKMNVFEEWKRRLGETIRNKGKYING